VLSKPDYHGRAPFLLEAIRTSLRAGEAILEVYGSAFSSAHKADDSPLTEADLRSNAIIASGLRGFGLPVVSEEEKEIPYAQRKTWESLWIVDPLDGTKEFIKRNGEFTVNIALIEAGTPVVGVILAPVRRLLYYAAREIGTFRLENPADFFPEPHDRSDKLLEWIISVSRRLPSEKRTDDAFIVAGSRSHATPRMDAFLQEERSRHRNVRLVPAGSSLKFCLVAEGSADVYPRFGPTMEWDTAAGQVVAEAAGARVSNLETGLPLVYNKANLLNPFSSSVRAVNRPSKRR
jgi:3'(2'), 5'-bisphosphate nucleotidase